MWKKLTAIFLVVFIIAGIWIWTFASINNSPIIIGGSTSANAFMQRLTTQMVRDGFHDYAYNSTGSQNGINGVKASIYNAGVISKDIDASMLPDWDPAVIAPPDDDSHITNGSELNICGSESPALQDSKMPNCIASFTKQKKGAPQKYTALEFALDAIVVIYHPPVATPAELNFSGTDLKEIYQGKTTWSKLLGTDVAKNENTIITFTRESGSGTRTAFQDFAELENFNYSDVVNSNGTMFSNVTSTVGSIGFVSYAFINQIKSDSVVYVAGINGPNGDVRFGYNRDDNPANYSMWDEATKSWKPTANKNEDAIKSKTKIYALTRLFIMLFRNKNIKKLYNVIYDMINLRNQWSMKKNESNPYVAEGLVPIVQDITWSVNNK